MQTESKKIKYLISGERCPRCNHDAIGHFAMIKNSNLVEPYPCECMEGCGCNYYLEHPGIMACMKYAGKNVVITIQPRQEGK